MPSFCPGRALAEAVCATGLRLTQLPSFYLRFAARSAAPKSMEQCKRNEEGPQNTAATENVSSPVCADSLFSMQFDFHNKSERVTRRCEREGALLPVVLALWGTSPAIMEETAMPRIF